MALITDFEKAPVRNGRHQSTTSCQWFVTHRDGEVVLQLDTGGSSERKHPGKPSQTLQLDRVAATRLLAIMRDAFPGL